MANKYINHVKKSLNSIQRNIKSLNSKYYIYIKLYHLMKSI